jgi:hypothetical protein
MKCLKNYFGSCKKALDAYLSALSKANQQFEKDFIKVR